MDRLCSHLVVLNRGSVVAAGTIGEVRESFAGLGLEAGFMQLTEQIDADRVANTIVDAVSAPVH
jgi:ABC-type uncharacterized transport system ATPase subunit